MSWVDVAERFLKHLEGKRGFLGFLGFLFAGVSASALFVPLPAFAQARAQYELQLWGGLTVGSLILLWTIGELIVSRIQKSAQRKLEATEREAQERQAQASNEEFRLLWNKLSHDEQEVLAGLHYHRDVDSYYNPRIRHALDKLIKLGLVADRLGFGGHRYTLTAHGRERMAQAMKSMHSQETRSRLAQ